MEFNVRSATEYAQRGKTEEYIQSYLRTGEWANLGLANGLKLKPRWWVGPLELPLARLTRKCGPEPTMKYRMPPEGWAERTGRIANTVTDITLLPPGIAEWVDGTLLLADGNHRHEGLRRKGLQNMWVFIWFNSKEEWSNFAGVVTSPGAGHSGN